MRTNVWTEACGVLRVFTDCRTGVTALHNSANYVAVPTCRIGRSGQTVSLHVEGRQCPSRAGCDKIDDGRRFLHAG